MKNRILNKVLFLILCWISPITTCVALGFEDTPESLLNYRPEKYDIDATQWKFLEAANWNEKKSLDSVRSSDLENLVCSSKAQDLAALACWSSDHSAIGERKTVCLNKDANCILALWLNTSAVMYSGAIIVKEPKGYSLYWFRRDMDIEDLDNNGNLEIVTRRPLIYKAWEFLGQGDDPSIWWQDVFTFQGTLLKSDQRYPTFYRKVAAHYKSAEQKIRRFDAIEYAARNKNKYAAPQDRERMLLKEKEDYLKILDTAIKAAEMISEKRK